ncbi:PREDICTED: gamma-aminobutyric acid receptor subunit beta-3-like [Branchiostoma belcheri]|uniref:Gamma-aminobutyric acid receptor subunit beta-3-like n=1 Tax=Branchiostoma belcheri TaxID=7741 RepID=A0A6P4XT70_BRABE|nr:PREDICTED: gamma-aminobutyric acid receptor subunit beta-3-like [Branchiostoma belcheri]
MNNPTNLLVIVILIARGYTRKLRYEEDSNFTEFDEAPYYFIFKNYDNRLRPNFAGTPVTVGIAIDVSSIDSISDQDMDYTMTMDLSQSWHDERLSFSGDVESYDLADDYLSKVWVPDTYFVNGKQSYFHEVTVKNRAMKIFSNGMIEYNLRLTTVASCMMNMMNYPMDVQNCSLVLESYGYTLKDIRLYWRHGRESITGLAGIQLPTFAIVDFQTSSGASQLDTGAFPRVVLNFQLHRDVGQVIFLIYVPCMLLVSLSWVAFWIDYKVVVGRVVLGMETFLALLTFITGVRKGLPKVAYIHTVDIYHLVCMVFVCATLIQYAVVNFKYYRPKKKGNKTRWQSAMSRRGKQRCNKDHHMDKAGIIQLLKMSSLMLNRKLAKNVKHSFAKIRRSHTAPCLSSFIRDQATSTKQALDLQLKKSPTGPLYFTDGESVESNNVLGTGGTHRDSRLLTNRHPCGSISGSEPRMLLRRRWRRHRTDSENTSDEEVKQKSSSSSTSFKMDTASNSPNIQRHNRVYRHRSNSDTATEGGKQRYEGTLTPTFARFTSDGDIQAFPPSSDKREGEQHGYREKSRHHTQNGTAHNLLVEWENEAVVGTDREGSNLNAAAAVTWQQRLFGRLFVRRAMPATRG